MNTTEPLLGNVRYARRGHLDISLKDFVEALVPEGFFECRAIDTTNKKVTGRAFIPAGDVTSIEAFLKRYSQIEIYFGVVSRQNDQDGTVKGCGKAFALFCDIDFKDIAEPEARRLLEAFTLKASIVIRSGNGLHCYWLLVPPYGIQSDPTRFKNLLRRLAIALHGDLKSADCAHVLRVIGTVNHKYAHNPVVMAEHFEPDVRYNLDDFEILPEEPEPKRKTAGDGNRMGEFRPATSVKRDEKMRRAAAYVATMDPAIEGSGGDHRTYCVGAVVARDFDLSVDDAMEVLQPWNARCKPQWNEEAPRVSKPTRTESGVHRNQLEAVLIRRVT